MGIQRESQTADQNESGDGKTHVWVASIQSLSRFAEQLLRSILHKVSLRFFGRVTISVVELYPESQRLRQMMNWIFLRRQLEKDDVPFGFAKNSLFR